MFNSRQQTLLGVEVALIIITAIVLTIRIYSRIWLNRSLGLDDVLMVIATVNLPNSWTIFRRIRATNIYYLGIRHCPDRGNYSAFKLWMGGLHILA